jgi:predicted dinucleotide-binding enzyme
VDCPGVHFTRRFPRSPSTRKARVVINVFNTIPSKIIELDKEKPVPYRIYVFLCSDDQQAKSIVSGLAEELGFVSVNRAGSSSGANESRDVADFIRFQIWAWARSRRLK